MRGRRTIVDRDRLRDEIARLSNELFDGALAPGISVFERLRSREFHTPRAILPTLGYPANGDGWSSLVRDLIGLEVSTVTHARDMSHAARDCQESSAILRHDRLYQRLRPHRLEYDPDEYPTGIKASRVVERDGKIVFLLR